MKRPKVLSAHFVKGVKDQGRYGDGFGSFGLSLLVRPTRNGRISKSWAQRLRINGKPVNIGLGSFPVVALVRARAKALENRRAVEQGKDPRSPGVPTFAEAFERVLEIHREGWKDGAKTEQQWRARLRDYALPVLGNKRVDRITTADVMDILEPIWTSKPETARQVRQRIGAVCKWAIAQGYRADNPAGEQIAAAMPKSRSTVKHQPALPHGEVGAALATIRAADAYLGTKLAFEFLVLTAARSGEVRGATWDEIDLPAATWTVPAARAKSARVHRVPLSDAALAVLERARTLRHGSALVFPSLRGKPMTDVRVSKLLRQNQIAGVPHGFRSSFRDWCSDTGQTRELAESALAHVVANRTEAAYARSDLFDRRRVLMQAWADYLG